MIPCSGRKCKGFWASFFAKLRLLRGVGEALGGHQEVQGALGDRGIEVRFPVDFRVEAASRVKKVCVSAAKLDAESPTDRTGAPSLVLRCMGRQESAWDLAKKYNTTLDSILSANQLEGEEDLPREKLLLIPRKRA